MFDTVHCVVHIVDLHLESVSLEVHPDIVALETLDSDLQDELCFSLVEVILNLGQLCIKYGLN